MNRELADACREIESGIVQHAISHIDVGHAKNSGNACIHVRIDVEHVNFGRSGDLAGHINLAVTGTSKCQGTSCHYDSTRNRPANVWINVDNRIGW